MTTWTARDILDDIDEGKLRLAFLKDEADAEAQRRQDEQKAGIEAAWAPVIDKIRESIPEWAWQYLRRQNAKPTWRSEHVTMVAPATIDLEDMGRVFAYTRPGGPFPLFVPAEWYLSDDDEAWSVLPSNGRSESEYSIPGQPDFLIALAQAYDNAQRIPEMKAEAERRNAERQKAKPDPAAPATRIEHDWLGLARIAVSEAREGGSQAAIAYALIGILEHLQLVTVPLYAGSQHAIQTFDNSRGQL